MKSNVQPAHKETGKDSQAESHTSDVPPEFNITRRQIDILVGASLAAHTPGHITGQDIKRIVNDQDKRVLDKSTVYTNLDTLVDAGYIKKSRHDRRDNSYDITPTGREVVQARKEWLAQGAPTNDYAVTDDD